VAVSENLSRDGRSFDDLVILRNTTFYDHVTELGGVWEGEELYQAKTVQSGRSISIRQWHKVPASFS